MFSGVSVALVTPFKNGALDEDGLRRVARHVLAQSVDGLVTTGSTGETPTLTPDERDRVWTILRKETTRPAFLVAGTGTNNTRETIELTQRAAGAGMDGCMVVAPYYNKPGQEAMKRHFVAVADASPVPLVLYNVPGRTGVNLLPKTVVALAAHPRIVAVKEASGSVDQATEICLGSDLTVLSGDDALTLPMMSVGAQGVVSVAGHLVGSAMVEMVAAFRKGEVAAAGEIHRRLFPLIQALFLESNPAPVKAALALLGIIGDEVRLPLVLAGEETRQTIRRALAEAGIPAPASDLPGV